MEILINAKGTNMYSKLSDHIKSKITHAVEKFLHNAHSAKVVVEKTKNSYSVEIVVDSKIKNIPFLKGSSNAEDAFSACDLAVAKIERQMRKHHHKMSDFFANSHNQNFNVEVTKTVFESTSFLDDYNFDLSENITTSAKSEPVILAQKTTRVETLTVAQAVMQMDLLDLPALVFINKNTNSLDFVYYRKDGNISWVESVGKPKN